MPPSLSLSGLTGPTPASILKVALALSFRKIGPEILVVYVQAGSQATAYTSKSRSAAEPEAPLIADAAGEVVATKATVEGRVGHLVLLLTCGLHFEGPTTNELMKSAIPVLTSDRATRQFTEKTGTDDAVQLPATTTAHSAAEPSGDAKDKFKVRVFSVPTERHRWVVDKYDGKEIDLSIPAGHQKPVSRMKTLEILENDAVDTFLRLAVAHYPVVAALETLVIRSTRGCDLYSSPPELFSLVLSSLTNLKHLTLSFGDVLCNLVREGRGGGYNGNPHPQGATSGDSAGDSLLPALQQMLPRASKRCISEAPVSFAPRVDELVRAQLRGGTKFLPSLQRIIFVLDTPEAGKVLFEPLIEAKVSCSRLLALVAARAWLSSS
ncbi:hypothetical protein B0T24DRAFT_669799 [Lasiosphaeria ovina]|uniref:Uncharacterized protein n=1 Tax=Lasiosphaeria ovina TaxID=92902 RepID=A0AAE0JXJ3_9PEZI|nr:hypothetical protein B0T24DRAFT_669799 [Lasiosphaeria ovina]